MTLDLHNFFKFYDEKNANHVAAVQWLEDKLPEKFLDDAETDWPRDAISQHGVS